MLSFLGISFSSLQNSPSSPESLESSYSFRSQPVFSTWRDVLQKYKQNLSQMKKQAANISKRDSLKRPDFSSVEVLYNVSSNLEKKEFACFSCNLFDPRQNKVSSKVAVFKGSKGSKLSVSLNLKISAKIENAHVSSFSVSHSHQVRPLKTNASNWFSFDVELKDSIVQDAVIFTISPSNTFYPESSLSIFVPFLIKSQ